MLEVNVSVEVKVTFRWFTIHLLLMQWCNYYNVVASMYGKEGAVVKRHCPMHRIKWTLCLVKQ